MTVVNLTQRTQEDNLISKSKYLIIFYGSDTCGHCKNIKPFFEQLSEKYPQVTFAYVEASKIATEKLTAFPTFVFYVDGIPRGTIQGADRSGLENVITITFNC